MPTPTFRIEKDHIGDGERDGKTYCPMGADPAPIPLPWGFRLYDDDMELYYEGTCNERGAELAFDWGIADSGCTCIETRVLGANEPFTVLIG